MAANALPNNPAANFDGNMFESISNMLKNGNCLAAYVGTVDHDNHKVSFKAARVFHDCTKDKCNGQNDEDRYLESHRVYFYAVNDSPSLLNPGELENFVSGIGHQECTCSLRDRVLTLNGVTHMMWVE